MDPSSPTVRTRTVAIASGKGGVGKTVVTANLALGLAQRLRDTESPVVAVDLDLGCGNLNACLGVRSPNGTVNHFLKGRVSALEGVLSPTEQANLQMICSSYSGQAEMQLGDQLKQSLLDGLRHLDASFVLMDLGAGTSADVLDLFLGADERIMVITPEAFSLHNAFVFLKTALLRLITRELADESFPSMVTERWQVLAQNPERFNLREGIEQMRAHHRYGSCLLQGLISELKIRLVVNRYQGGLEKSYLINFNRLLAKHLALGPNVSSLGFVHFDLGIQKSVQGVRPFLLRYPDNPAASDIRELATGLYQDDHGDHHCFCFPPETVSSNVLPTPVDESTTKRTHPNGAPETTASDPQISIDPSQSDGVSLSSRNRNGRVEEENQDRSQDRKGRFSKDILEIARRLTKEI